MAKRAAKKPVAKPAQPAKRTIQFTHDESKQPHAPDVLERETADNGFSAGWGLHHPPSETYIIDCHTHYRGEPDKKKDILRVVDKFYKRAGAMRLRRHVALSGTEDNMAAFGKAAAKDDRFLWMLVEEPVKPDLELLKKAAKLPGFVGLKVLNIAMMRGIEGSPEDWNRPEWDDVLAFLGDIGKPVLWHVTQRVTDCPHMGGGVNSYWKENPDRKRTFTNQNLLDMFMEKVTKHPKTNIIGAHHLHIGPEKAAKLFDSAKNLHVDLSCGNMVRPGDTLYEDDAERWRNYVLKYADRLLFGTDCILGAAGIWYLWETLAGHIRFIHQLRLPKDALEKVTRENFERLAGLAPVELDKSDWQATRP
jgi:predicted TIM-barrel fold metal-dependent hydrolase